LKLPFFRLAVGQNNGLLYTHWMNNSLKLSETAIVVLGVLDWHRSKSFLHSYMLDAGFRKGQAGFLKSE
jgi:hypothetical protein